MSPLESYRTYPSLSSFCKGVPRSTPARGLCPQKPQQCLGPEQGSRPRLPKPLIRRGYYQWPKRLRVARVQPSQAARSAASSPHSLTLQGIQAVADRLHRAPQCTQPQGKQAAPFRPQHPLLAESCITDSFAGPWQRDPVSKPHTAARQT